MRCGVAIKDLNQHKSPLRTSEKTRKRSRKTADLTVRDRSDRSLWAVRPVGLDLKFQTSQTGFTDRSDWFLQPVRPVSATGQTASTQNRIPARELEVISRLLVQIITKWFKICREVPGIETNLSTKRINPKHKGSLEFRGGKRQKRVFQKLLKPQSKGFVIHGGLALG